MMLKITERCTMGCPHCLNNAMPDGKDMTLPVLQDCLTFLKEHNLAKETLIITGGEPTEHRDFDRMMMEILHKGKGYFTTLTVTTNGEKVLRDPERFKGYVKTADESDIFLLFQVSADTRFYPRRIETHKRIFREPGFVVCDNCVERIYPQGRAWTNQLKWESKASKCYNVRALSHQLPESITLRDIELTLFRSNKHCTPHIGVNGEIRLGESDLCPVCASIYDDMKDIMQKIRAFKCHGCDHINDRLPDMYKNLL